MPIRTMQASFALGELDPRLIRRTDFEGYYKGLRRAHNCLVVTQGSIRKRFGLLFGFSIVDTGDADEPVTDPNEVNGVVYDHSLSKSFCIIARPHDRTGTAAIAFDIYLNDALQATVTTTDYTIAQIPELFFIRAQNRIIILHESVQPHQLVRGANDATWTLSAISFGYTPTWDFSFIDGLNYHDGTTFTPSAVSGAGITVTASVAKFTAGHVGGLFIGNGGIMRITAVNAGGTVATGTTITDFDSTSAINGQDCVIKESAWGDFTGGTPVGKDRGWPSVGAIFNNRLVLGGSLGLPNILSFSVAGDFLDMDDSEGLDTNGFSLSLNSDGDDQIRAVVASKGLIAITASSIYSTSLYLDNLLTPGNAYMPEQDKVGSEITDAQILDSQVFFIDQNGQRVRSMMYDITGSSYAVLDASIASAHLIDTPISTGEYKPDNDDGAFFMANNSDGSLAIFQSLARQNISAWTPQYTQGSFDQVISSRNNAWFLIQRYLGTGTTAGGDADNVYTANSDFELLTDVSAAFASAVTNVSIFTKDGDYVLIGHQIPFYKVTVTLSTPSNATLNPVFEYLDNTGTWTTFTPTDGTTGFTGNGDITWDLDADTDAWVPQDLSKYLESGVVIPTDTLNGPVKKFWIRISRNSPGVIDSAFIVDPSFSIFTDIGQSLDDPSTDENLFSQQNEYLLIGHSSTFGTLNVDLNTAASADIVATFEFLDSTGTWVTFAPTDGTAGFTGNGAITWTASSLTNWAASTVNGNSDLYWIRIRRTVAALVTIPIENTIFLNITTTPIEQTFKFNVAKRLYIESADYDEYLDATEVTTSDANGLVTGLTHLVGNQVYALVDNIPEGPFFVSTAGEITVSTESANVRVGIMYAPSVIPMPPVAPYAYASTVFTPKHVMNIYLNYYESLGLIINGTEIPTLSLNNFALDRPPVPATGVYQMDIMRGWNPLQEIEITQDLPLPFNIIGIGYRVETT